LALVRLLTVASAFWLAVQLGRNAAHANLLAKAIVTIVAAYATYGLVIFALKAGRFPWLESPSTAEFVSSTFVNHNSFATYAGLGLVACCGLICRLYQHEAANFDGPLRLRIASVIESTGRNGAFLIGAAFLILAALLLTGSRGGIVATGLGLGAFAILTFSRQGGGALEYALAIGVAFLLVAATLFTFGDNFFSSLSERGVIDSGRITAYSVTMRSIFDVPLFGYGYGTFADVFPMYRDRSLDVLGTWEHAHNTYLEAYQGLGLIFGSMFVASLTVLVVRCIQGSIRRHGSVTAPRVAAGAAVLIGSHALVDFSLEMQAVALTFVSILGAGTAQSKSSRQSLED
jgi:O-antigen ligase